MAKGKTPKSNKTKLAARGKQKASAQAGGKVKAAKAAPKEPASESAAFTGIAIGHAAGEIWGFLSSDGGQTLGAIQKSVGAPSEVVLAAVGWLAREDKLAFETTGRTVNISLK